MIEKWKPYFIPCKHVRKYLQQICNSLLRIAFAFDYKILVCENVHVQFGVTNMQYIFQKFSDNV